MTDEEKNAQIMHFVPVETIQATVEKEFEKQKSFLLSLMPRSDIQHVGSTAVPRSLTKGDLDVQVRVPREEFNTDLQKLLKYYRPNRQNEIWTGEFASFERYDNPVIPVGVQLTVTNSQYDEFYKIRDIFLTNPDLLEKYNSIKKSCEGKTYAEYRKEKRALFGINGSNPLLTKQ